MYRFWLLIFTPPWSVCLSEHNPGTTSQTSANFLCFFTCCRGSVLLWRRCNTLCTSGFVDDLMFSHNGPHVTGNASIGCKLEMTHRGPHDMTSRLGSSGLGAESDVYDFMYKLIRHGHFVGVEFPQPPIHQSIGDTCWWLSTLTS